MRQSLLRKGMGDFCTQMKNRNAPLKMSPDSPVTGRFYPTTCSATEADTLNVSFSGRGYVWTNVTKKVTFDAGTTANFRYDFQVTDGDACDIYAYFRPASITNTQFTTHRVENGLVGAFSSLTSLGNNMGQSTLASKLQEGFTVVARDGDQSQVEMDLGIVPLGKKPFHPYQVDSSDGKITYENERTEVHQNERDFVGPIVVEGDKRAIYLTASVDGAPAIDVIMMRKADAEASLQLFYEYPQIGPLSGVPMSSEVLAQGNHLQRTIVVPAGTYYVVFDNSATAGQAVPAGNPLDDRAAVVQYLIQIGDAQ